MSPIGQVENLWDEFLGYVDATEADDTRFATTLYLVDDDLTKALVRSR